MTDLYSYRVLGSKDEELSKWDKFVDQCERGSFFHLSGWKKVIEQVFKHKSHFIYAEQDGVIVGVLPLVEQKSLLFGHTLVSTPFCVYGGVASDSDEVMLFLENKAIELAKQLAVDYLELRYSFARNNSAFTEKCAHSAFGCAIAADDETILAGVKKKQRANIRRSLENNLTYRVDDDTTTAYQVYSESVRNLGTPVFSARFFGALQHIFADKCDVLTVEHQGRAVSSVLSFYYKGQVLPYYGGGLDQARALKSNDFMYYQLMCSAKGSKQSNYFDFGRSKDDSGAYKYKRTWGMEPKPLHYMFYLVSATELPNLSPNNPKYQLLIRMWKKLPVSVSRLIGPFLSKYLG
ncbi:FemAB family XrtA/PEP-CTERM system-associated protein [uncultured Paraglaciecola sp.]|uniref:FemAB family XrtA/PEP-CTERM system-associated protein n=1 Tax=uncultured Paraglaciecola sp. TaxID=1765024 RepID=UPI002606482B|nr:FemAB family XrtA/PEP-CTERM system-associated protein [uncultured Paraglaciecola sp.]